MKNEYIMIYAIIPSYLYKTKELTGEEKLLAERITALCRQKGYSWISNKSLAELYGIREDTVSRHIKKLKEVGFIKCLYAKTQIINPLESSICPIMYGINYLIMIVQINRLK